MFSTAIAAAISAILSAAAGTALGLMVSGSRVKGLRAEVEQIEQVLPLLVGRQEVAQLFNELAMLEEQRHREAQMRRQQAVPFPVTPAPAPVAGPSPQELNDLLTQQLASLNARLQQVNGRRVAPPPAGYSQPSAG